MVIFLGEWLVEENMKKVKGSLEIPEFSFGELDDLEVTFYHVTMENPEKKRSVYSLDEDA